MRILIAPDSFKGTMTAAEICALVGNKIKTFMPDAEIDAIPVADGGEGTVDAFVFACGAERKKCTVTGPDGRKTEAEYALTGKTAIIEMAQASGLPLMEKPDPFTATTFGTGEVIINALNEGAEKLVIGIGGSATNDGGIGCLAAVGTGFFDKENKPVEYNCRGAGKVEKIDLSAMDKRLKNTEITVLCDVENPLCGENGASYIYGPQKGAKEADLSVLDENLRHFSQVCERSLGITAAELPGSGAAGGLGFGLRAFLGAKLTAGAPEVLKLCGFEERAKKSDFIITGEGRFDRQSLMGKVPGEVLKRSGGKKVIVLCGNSLMSQGEAENLGFYRIVETDPLHRPYKEVRARAKEDMKDSITKEIFE